MQEVTKHGVEQKCLLKAREYLLELRICLHNRIDDEVFVGMFGHFTLNLAQQGI